MKEGKKKIIKKNALEIFIFKLNKEKTPTKWKQQNNNKNLYIIKNKFNKQTTTKL